jgi:hypothetical protein
MDANENMTNGHMERMLSSKDIGMRPVMLKNHPDLPLTPMYMRGLQPGRVAVDEVWVTDDLPVDIAGWLAVHKCPGNHHIVMIEIDTKALLGDDLLQITRPPDGLSHTTRNIESSKDFTGSMPPQQHPS